MNDPLSRRVFLSVLGSLAVGCGSAGDTVLVDDDASVLDDTPAPSEDTAAPAVDTGSPTTDTAAPIDTAAPPPDVAASLDAGAPVDIPRIDTGTPTPPVDVPAPPVDVPRADAGSFTPPSSIEVSAQFPQGVMAGDAQPARAMLWTKYNGGRTLVVRVYEADGNSVTALVREVEVNPTDDGYVHYDAGGLRAGQRYRYVFVERQNGRDVGRSPIGAFRTAIAQDALETITFGGTSCHKLADAPFPWLERAAEDDLDFFLHAGDHIYVGDEETHDLSDYRFAYQRYWPNPQIRQLHASVGLYQTWDDHEVMGNWCGAARPGEYRYVPPAKLAAATRAYFEHTTLRRFEGNRDRIFRSFRWGRTAEIFMTDTRSERRREGDRIMSDVQMQWLKDGLRSSEAVFKFVVTSVPITRTPDSDSWPDKWAEYDAQRSELLDFIVNRNLTGVWFLSGDLHFGRVARVEDPSSGDARRRARSELREVLMGPGGSQGSINAVTERPSDQVDVRLGRNHTRFRADPRARTLTVTYIGDRGQVLFRREYRA